MCCKPATFNLVSYHGCCEPRFTGDSRLKTALQDCVQHTRRQNVVCMVIVFRDAIWKGIWTLHSLHHHVHTPYLLSMVYGWISTTWDLGWWYIEVWIRGGSSEKLQTWKLLTYVFMFTYMIDGSMQYQSWTADIDHIVLLLIRPQNSRVKGPSYVPLSHLSVAQGGSYASDISARRNRTWDLFDRLRSWEGLRRRCDGAVDGFLQLETPRGKIRLVSMYSGWDCVRLCL